MRLIISIAALLSFCVFSNAQSNFFYPSKIDSSAIADIYEQAMLALLNEEDKKFFTKIEQVIVADSTCFKALAHAAFKTFQITKGEEPFGLLTSRALKIEPQDWVESAYSDVLKAQLAGEIDKIPSILEKMIGTNEAIEGYFLLGKFYEASGNLEAAHLNYYRAFRLDYCFAPAYHLMAKTSQELGYPDLSTEMIETYVEMHSNHPKTHDIYGNYLMKKGDAKGAIEQFKKAYSLDSTYYFSLEKAEKMSRAIAEKAAQSPE